MTTRSLASTTSRWLSSMSSTARMAWTSSTVWPPRSNRLWAMVRKGRPRASAWAIEGVAACTAVFSAADCSPGAEVSAPARRVPRRQVVGRVEAGEETADVELVFRILDQDGVVDVPGGLLPRVEHHLLPGVIGPQRGHGTLERVVAHGGADPHALIEAECVGVVEEWLELLDRLALVVEDRPSAADPARADHRPTVDHGAGFGRDFLLD